MLLVTCAWFGSRRDVDEHRATRTPALQQRVRRCSNLLTHRSPWSPGLPVAPNRGDSDEWNTAVVDLGREPGERVVLATLALKHRKVLLLIHLKIPGEPRWVRGIEQLRAASTTADSPCSRHLVLVHPD